ncbi:MAG: BatA domain-containing protein, partial [Armatimonadota bacterium]
MPILMHLFGRRRARRVPFPSLMLRRVTPHRQRSLVRLRHLLLLLLRVLAVLLLAMAMARPVARSRVGWLPASGGAALAIVLDDSFSMSKRAADGVLFDRAIEAGREVVRAAAPGDAVLTITASGVESRSADRRDVGPGTVGTARGREDAARGLRTLTASDEAVPIGGAVERALEWLARASAATKHMYVFSDMQRRAWPAGGFGARVDPDVDVVVVDVAREDEASADGRSNHLIESIEVLNEPTLVGRPARIRVSVRQYGRPRDERTPIELAVDGEALPAKSLPLAEDTSQQVEFSHVFAAAGTGRIVARTLPDALPADDVRYATVDVRDRIRAVCIDERPIGAKQPGAARFLVAALSPGGSDRPVAARTIPASSAAAEALRGADVVILADVPRLSEDLLAAVHEFTDAGGGVLIFVGERADARFYDERLLPTLCGSDCGVTLGGRIGTPGDEANYFVISEFVAWRPPLAAFGDTSGGDLLSIHFYAVRDVRVARGPSAPTVLARFDDG